MGLRRVLRTRAQMLVSALGDKSGLTLIETMVTVALLILLIGAASPFYLTGWKAWMKATDAAIAQQQLMLGFERMTRELREAYEIHSETGLPLDQIVFENSYGETVVYSYEPEDRQLIRAVYAEDGGLDYWQVIASDVTAVSFEILSRYEEYPGGRGGGPGGAEGTPGNPENPGTPGEQGPPDDDNRPEPPGQVGNPGENDRPPPPGHAGDVDPERRRKRRGHQDDVDEQRILVEASMTVRGGETDYSLASYVYVRNVY